MKRYTVGIIGCGRIGSLLEDDSLRGKPCTHAGGFNALSSTHIVAGCDIDPERLERFGKRWKVSRLYTDYRQMLSLETLDIVCIATWTPLHHEMVMQAARAGVRGIFCEKPIAMDRRQAEAMVRACARRKIPLVINHERRWEPYYQIAQDLVRRGKIGEVRTLVGNALSWKPGKLPIDSHGGGPLFHDGTHLTDLLLYFGGPVDWVEGHAVRPHGERFIEETAWGILRFKNGAMGFIEGGGARRYFNFELDIQGSEGRILIGNSGRELYVARKSKRFTGFQELERVPFPEPKRYESPFIGGARDMVQCLRTDTKSASSGRDGLNALKLILAVYASARQNGRRIQP